MRRGYQLPPPGGPQLPPFPPPQEQAPDPNDPLAGFTPDWRERTGKVRGVFQPRPMHGQILPAVGKLLQGATFGLSDEIIGGVRGALSPNLSIGEAIEAERGELDRFSREHGAIAAASELAGGLASGGGALKGAAKLRGLARVPGAVRAMGAGAGAAAAYGAGTAEGGLVERGAAAAKAAPLGAATAGALHGAGRGISRLRRAADMEAPSTAAAGRQITTPAGMRRRVSSDEARAASIMEQSMERAQVTPEGVARWGQTRGRGKPVNIMDAAGDPMQKLGRATEAIPSRGGAQLRSTLEKRNIGQRDRVVKDIDELSGLPQEDIFARADEILARRKEAAAPLYRAAHFTDDAGTQLRTVPKSVIGEELNDPAFQRAAREAERIARREGHELPPLFVETSEGVALVSKPSVKALDYMKQGLDDLIEKRMRGGKMSRREARLLREKLNGVLAKVDEAVPEYREARAAWSGGSREREALEMGLKGMSKDPRLIRREMAGLPEEAREVYRAGLLDAIRRSRIDRRARHLDVAKGLGDKTEDVARLRATFRDADDFEEFMRRLSLERDMFETSKNVLSGSVTTRLQQEVADLRSSAGSLGSLAEVAMNPMRAPEALARAGLRGAMQRKARGITEGVVDELGPRLSGDLQETIDWLRQMGQARAAAELERQLGRAGKAGAVAGMVSGR